MRQPHSPARQCCCKARALALYIHEVVDWPQRDEVAFRNLYSRVVDHANSRSIPLDRGAWTRQTEPGPGRTEVDRPTHQRVTLIDVVGLRHCYESPLLVEPMGPSDV